MIRIVEFHPRPFNVPFQETHHLDVPEEVKKFIEYNMISISAERLITGEYALYFDYGAKVGDDPSEDPEELIRFADSKEFWGKEIEAAIPTLMKLLKTRKLFP